MEHGERLNVHMIKVSEMEVRQTGEKAVFEEVFPKTNEDTELQI